MPQVLAAAANWLGGLLFNWGVSSGLAYSIANTVVYSAYYLAVGYGLSAVSSLFRPKPSIPSAEDGRLAVRQPTAPRQAGYGRARIAGAYMCYEERAGSSFDVVAFHDGLIDGVERHFLNDEEVAVVAGVVQATVDGAYAGGTVRFRTNLGPTPNVAFSETVGNLSDIWTTQHRGDGVAQIELICQSVGQQDIARIYPSGLPTPSVVARLQKVFDPRDASQAWGNKASWKWSDNPILCLLHFLTDAAAGMAMSYEQRIEPALASWIAAANVCDELVPLKGGGTEKRYRCGGWFYLDSDPIEVVDMLITCCDGWIAQRGDGALVARAGKFYSPTVTFSEDHILEFSTQRYVGDEDAVNELIVGYTTPVNYADVEAPAWIDEEDKAARGKDRIQNVRLTWCQSRSQARRLAKRQVRRSNSAARGWIRVNMFGHAAMGERFIRIQNAALPSLADITAEVTRIEFDVASMTMTIAYVEMSAVIDAWDAAAEEGEAESVPDSAGSVLTPTPTGVQANACYATLGLNQVSLAMRVAIDTPGRTDLGFVIGWGVRGTGNFTDRAVTRTEALEDSGNLAFIVPDAYLAPNTYYVAHVATVAPGGTYSTFVEADAFTFEPLPPPPPINITLTGGAGKIDVDFKSPDLAFHHSSGCYIAAAGATIFDSTLAFETAQARNTADSETITGLAAGVYLLWFWTRRDNSSGVLTQAYAGPFEVTVT